MPTIARSTPEYILTLDPNDQFPEAGIAALLESGGLLTGWLKSYFQSYQEAKAPISLKSFMQGIYQCGELIPMKMTLHPDDHLSYPGDPDMHPLISIAQPTPTTPPLRALIYQYGIITLIQGGETFITRMD